MELNAIDVYTDTVKFFCVKSWMFDIGMGSHAAVQSAGTPGIWGRGSQAGMNWTVIQLIKLFEIKTIK